MAYLKAKEVKAIAEANNLTVEQVRKINTRYNNLKSRCKHSKAYKHVEVTCSLAEFVQWAVEVDLLNNWDGHISRHQDCGDYAIGNFSLKPASDNRVEARAKTHLLYLTDANDQWCPEPEISTNIRSMYNFLRDLGQIAMAESTFRRKILARKVITTKIGTQLKFVPCK